MVSNYYLEMIEDGDGNLEDINYYHRFCAPGYVLDMGGWPCIDWPDYSESIICSGCEELIHRDGKE